jgi:hypothetical protein
VIYSSSSACTLTAHRLPPRFACWNLFGDLIGGAVYSIEMRHDVTTASFRIRKAIDNLLYRLSGKQPETLASLRPRFEKEVYPSGQPQGWMPLYTMVTFRPDIGYAAAKSKAERQAATLNALGFGGGLLGVVSLVAGWAVACHRFGRKW